MGINADAMKDFVKTYNAIVLLHDECYLTDEEYYKKIETLNYDCMSRMAILIQQKKNEREI